jgi:hypothetical protein
MSGHRHGLATPEMPRRARKDAANSAGQSMSGTSRATAIAITNVAIQTIRAP